MKSVNIIALLAVLSVLSVAQAVPASANLNCSVHNITGGENVTSITTTIGNATQITTAPVAGDTIWYYINLSVIMDYKCGNLDNFKFAVPDNSTNLTESYWYVSNGTNTVAADAVTAGDYNNVTFTDLGFDVYNTTEENVSYINITFSLKPFTETSHTSEYKSGTYNDTWIVTNLGTDLTITDANITVTPTNYAKLTNLIAVTLDGSAPSSYASVGSNLLVTNDLSSAYTLQALYSTETAKSATSHGKSPSGRAAPTLGVTVPALPDWTPLAIVLSVIIAAGLLGAVVILKRK